MLLKLLSNAFIFEKGTALAMPWDAIAEGGMDDGSDPRPYPFKNDEIELSGVNRAGEYQLVAGELTVLRKSDRLSFPISMLMASFNVTDDDLKSGHISLEIAAQSVYKVTVLDRELQPVSGRRLTFYPDATAMPGPLRIASMGIKPDGNGTFYFLGNSPCNLWFQLDAETGLSIVPV